MKKSYAVALGIAAAAGLWIFSGLVFAPEEEVEISAAERAAEARPQELTRVQVERSTAVPRTREVVVSGRTEASRVVTIRAETESMVEDILVPRGTAVAKGQPLLKLAVEDRAARLAKAKALVAKRELEFRAAEDLSKKSFTSEVSFANAKAELESARADLAAAELEMARIIIRAPFDGVFNQNQVEVGDYVRVGDNLAEMVDLDPLLVVAQLAELSIGDISVGTPARAELITGANVTGEITYASAKATGTTRTFEVEMSVENPDGRLVDGLTATLFLPAQEVMAHRIQPSALTLSDAGAVGVKIVDENNTVQFVAANPASQTTDGVWLTNLPETVTVITVGQEYVAEGQKVTPVLAPNGSNPSNSDLRGPLGAVDDERRLAQSEEEQP